MTYTIYKMDLETGECFVVKHVNNEAEAKNRVAGFNRLVKRVSDKAAEDWRYSYRPSS